MVVDHLSTASGLANLSAHKRCDYVEAKIEVENITNSVYPINLGSEFNGSHVSQPRLLTLRLAYRY